MTGSREAKVIQKFREYVASEALPENVKVTYRVSGGMPSERVEEEFTLSSDGKATVATRDVLDTAMPQEASSELQTSEVRELLQQIGEGFEGLVTRSEASFLPDSLVGTITIEVDGEGVTLYFLADEEERQVQSKPITPQMSQAVQRIRTMSRQFLKKESDNG
jgi:hypothetical protein